MRNIECHPSVDLGTESREETCSTCNARNLCNSRTGFDEPTPSGFDRLTTRESQVQVTGTPDTGFRAACLVFGVPVLLMLVTFCMTHYIWNWDDTVSLLATVPVWIVYFGILYATRSRFNHGSTGSMQQSCGSKGSMLRSSMQQSCGSTSNL